MKVPVRMRSGQAVTHVPGRSRRYAGNVCGISSLALTGLPVNWRYGAVASASR